MTSNDEALKLIKALSRSLTGLTPGGSEFFNYSPQLDIYYADTKACENVIRDRFESGHRAMLESVDYRRELEATRSEAAKCLAAIQEITKLPKLTVDQALANPDLFQIQNTAMKIAKKALKNG